MKPSSTIFIVLFVSILASYATVKVTSSGITDKSATQEPAYDRVMRTGTIRCGYAVWPPYFQRDEKTGQLTGMLKEALDEMFTSIGVKIEYVESVLGQQPQDLKTGKYDSFCFDSFLMPVATKFLDYSNPWMEIPMFLYGRENHAQNQDLEKLNVGHVSFSAMDGDLSSDLVLRFFPKAKMLSLPATADPALLMLNVTTHKADVVIMDPLSVTKFNATNADKMTRIHDQPIAVYPINFSVNKNETGLRDMINYAVDIFVHTGKYDQLFEKYDPEHDAFIKV